MMFRRIWERVAKLWRPTPCARCGAPAVALVMDMTGKLLTKDPEGKPVTKYYVRGAEWRCRACQQAGA